MGLIVASGLLGVLVLEIIERFHLASHHHHDTKHDHEHTGINARKLLFTDAIHNVADGVLLVPAFAVDVRLGIATAVAIFLHEAVQEVSEFFVLKEAGYSTKKALTLNFLVSSTILIGVGLGVLASFRTRVCSTTSRLWSRWIPLRRLSRLASKYIPSNQKGYKPQQVSSGWLSRSCGDVRC